MTYSGLHYDELRKQAQLESWQRSEEQNVPLGYGFANAVEGGINKSIGWLKEQAEDDPDTWTDDALRLMGGGLKNISNIPGMGLIGKVGEVGGHAGAGIAEMMGVDPRLGRWAGSFAADSALGFGVGKVARTAQLGRRTANLGKTVLSKADDVVTQTGRAVDRALTPKYAYAGIDSGYLDDAADLVSNRFASTTIPELTSVAGKPRYTSQVPKLTDAKLRRTGDKASGALGNQDIASLGISKTENTLFNKLKALQTEIGAHHHVFDHKLAGDALNRIDAPQVMKELGKLGVRPGNSRYNIIMAFHEKSGRFIKEFHDAMQLQRKAKGLKPLTQRQLDDLTKAPVAKEGIFKGNPDIPEFARAGEPMFKKVDSYDDYYSRFEKFGIDRKKIKLNPKNFILGQDHLEIIHEAYKKVPAWQEVQDLITKNKWRTLPPKEAAQKLAEVNRIQTNIAIKVSKYRLDLVKNHIKDLHTRNGVLTAKGKFILNNPKHIRKWMVDNPAEAATLGWGKKVPSLKEMMGKPGEFYETTKEIRAIFDTSIGKPKLTRRQLAIGASDITKGQALSIGRYKGS